MVCREKAAQVRIFGEKRGKKNGGTGIQSRYRGQRDAPWWEVELSARV